MITNYPEGQTEELEAVNNPDVGGSPDLICEDFTDDGVRDAFDNCPATPNPGQEDTYPPQGNSCGNACECEGNYDGDPDVDGSDAAVFKADFGRSAFKDPCTNSLPCNGDFSCDVDVDGSDAAVFKGDFGRSAFKNPCANCVTVPWCVYP